ncbi:DNA sulfur modification protein DndB [Bhargavaea massiliensis]|uniref:DNA sulfur modification protein DndB n=1 Tax=Bhargavaea massiliensis TaxID=2697500 RepID=UPI001BD18667|nr:DNA sulfur modification protein DndB [Bhargavaea massiliensis]
MDTSFCYSFPALRGKQAGKEYYVVMCPLRLIPRLFLFNEEEIPAQFRAQRILNKARIPELTNYIVENKEDYVFSSITASIDGEAIFEPYQSSPSHDIGQLKISMDARFLINDGQHRRAAIEEALKIAPELSDESISVVFYKDVDLKHAQQMFSDLNRHAVNTTSSIGILYDHRDEIAMLTKDIVSSIPLLQRYTDTEKVSLSKNSPKVFALNHIFNANLKLLGKSKGESFQPEEEQFAKDFWISVCKAIPEWKMVLAKELSPRDLRTHYINGHGVFIEALGVLGNDLKQRYPKDWKKYVEKLEKLDWSRTNTSDWLDRAFNNTGRIQKNNNTVLLTTIRMKQLLNVPLSNNEIALEEKFFPGGASRE